MDALSTPPDEPIDFTLRFLDGRGLLGLRQPVRVALASLERLELEVPNLRFPFDLSGGPNRFQNRRCRFREARVTLSEARLVEWLGERRLASYGVEGAAMRVGDGRIHVAFDARVGERLVPVTARIRVEPLPGEPGRRVRVVLGDVRVYGWLPVPAPLLAMALLLGAGAQPADGSGQRAPLVLRRVAEVELDPLDEVLWHALVPVGWRLPARGGVRVTGIHVGAGRVELAFADARDRTGKALPATDVEAARCPAGEELLADNDLDGALAAFREAYASAPHPQLFERILALLVASPGRWNEAIALVKAEAEGGPAGSLHVAAQLALANIEAERGQIERAAGRFSELAALARVAGEVEDEAAALLRAAELYLGADASRATALLERLLGQQPAHARAAELLAGCYAKEGRFADLARLEGDRIALAQGPEAQARAHARFARVLLDHMGQAARAKDELERAVRLNTFDANVWYLLGRAYAETGERGRGIGALDCVVALSQDPALRADAHVRAARLLLEEGADNYEPALARFQAALAIDPRHAEAIAGETELYAKTGRFEDATAAFERAFSSVEPGHAGNALRRGLLLAEADRCRARGAMHEARELLERASQYGDDREVLERLAALAESDGRHADAERALARLAAMGDASASLRRARALLGMGEAATAREAAQAAMASNAAAPPPGFDLTMAAQVITDACRALGDTAGLRAAIDWQLSLKPEGEPLLRVEAAALAIAAGEPEVAERHLGLAGEHRAALELRADLLEARGDDAGLDDTLARLVRTLGDDPIARARAMLRQATLRSRGDRLTEALECYRAAASLFPDGTSEEADAARAGQGRTAYLLERWDEARAAWEPLHDRGVPPRAQRALRLGEIALRQRDAEGASRFYRAALDLGITGTDVARSYDALISSADGRGDARAAVEALIEAAQNPRTGETPPQRAERLVSAARRQMEAGDREAAARSFERALAIDADSREALDGLEALAARTGDALRTANALSRRADAARDRPRERKALLIRLAEVQSEQLGRTDAAVETHRLILQIDPDHRPSLALLAREARQASEPDEERKNLERLARLGGDDMVAQADVHARLARLTWDAGAGSEAEHEARRALELSPRHAGALALLDELLSREERYTELEPLLALRAEVEPQFERALDVEYRRAAILEQLGRRDEALAAYDRIVQVRPSAAAAWERMATLHRQAGAWQPLLDVLGRLAAGRAASGEPAEAAAVAVEMAHLAHDRLGDPALSRRSLERALAYDPRCALALDGLLGLARNDGDSAAEDELLGRRIDAEDEPPRREALLVERARGRRDRGDLEGAIALLDGAPVERASDTLLRLRVQLADTIQAPEGAVAALEELARRARSAGDTTSERDLVLRLARLAATEKRRGPEAEALYQRAIELDPDDVDSASALVEVERERKAPAERLTALETLLKALRRRRNQIPREAEVALEIAKALRSAGDVPGAVARLREALSLAPDRVEIMSLLGEALFERGEVDSAIRMLEQAVERKPDRAVWALLGVAYEARGDIPKAAAAFDAAGDAADPMKRADALERAGREDEALVLWRGVGGAVGRRRAAALLLRWARHAQQSDRPEEASQLALSALAEGPCEPEALRLATANLDADGLWALVDRTAPRLPAEEAAQLWRSAAALLPHAMARAALERAVATAPDAESFALLAHLEGGEAGAAHAREALRIDPASAPAALALAALAHGPDVIPALQGAWRRVSPDARPALSVAMGEQLRDVAGDAAAARDAFQRAIDEGATGETAGAALRGLAQIDQASGNVPAAIASLQAAREQRVALPDDLRRLAELRSERGEHNEAIVLLREAGAPTPLLARALEAAGRYAELVDALEQSSDKAPPHEARAALVHAATVAEERLGEHARAAALLERATPLGPADADLWVLLGQLYAGPLANPEQAAAAYARAHAADPERSDVLVPLADYHFEANELEPAEDYYRLALRHAGNGALHGEARAERGRIHLRLADIAACYVNPATEETELRAAAADGVIPAWSRLAERYREMGDDVRRAEALLAWAESEPQRQVTLYREARPLLDAGEAARIDELIARLDPSDEGARARVLGRLRAAGNDAALARRLVEEIGRSEGQARRALQQELGEVCERAGDDEGAFAAWSAVVSQNRTLDAGRRLLASARRTGRGAEAGQVLEAALQKRPEASALIAEAYLAPGGDRDRALPWIDRAIETGSTEDRGPAFRALLRAAGRWREVVADIDAEAARLTGAARIALELEAAEIVEQRMEDVAAAAVRFSRAYDLDPREHEIAAHARNLFLAAGNRIGALSLLDREIEAAGTVEAAALRALRSELAGGASPSPFHLGPVSATGTGAFPGAPAESAAAGRALWNTQAIIPIDGGVGRSRRLPPQPLPPSAAAQSTTAGALAEEIELDDDALHEAAVAGQDPISLDETAFAEATLEGPVPARAEPPGDIDIAVDDGAFDSEPTPPLPALPVPRLPTARAVAAAEPLLPVPLDVVTRRGSPEALYAALKSQLARLPLDAVDRITDLRQRLGELARDLGDTAAARSYFELVLAQHPERTDALRPLVALYADAGEAERSAEVLGRLAYLAPTSEERAEWTYRQAEVLRQQGDEDGANAGYLRAADHHPEHAPTLRRLIAFYFAEGELGSLLEVLAELQRQDEPIGESVLEAGLGLSIAGEDARAAALLAGTDAARLAEVLSTIRIDDGRYVDQALRAAARALPGGDRKGAPLDLPALPASLEAIVTANPARIGARVAAARLAERTSDVARARAHLAVLAWVDPDSEAARRLHDLPPATPITVPEEPVHPAAAGPLRDALRLLGPLTIGVAAPQPGAMPLADWAARLLPLGATFGFAEVAAALVEEQAEPVWAEATAPPRLLIRRDMLADEPAVIFAAARALHLLRAGVPVVDERAEEDLAALLTAAAALFDGSIAVESSLERAWLDALRSLPFHPDALSAGSRVALQQALRQCAQPGVAATGPAFCRTERFTADRVAFALTGDVGAGLHALAPELTSAYDGRAQRAAALAQPGPIRELLAYVFSREGLHRIGGLG